MVPDQVRDAVGERTGLPASRTSHHQKRALMVINGPALGVIETSQKTHDAA